MSLDMVTVNPDTLNPGDECTVWALNANGEWTTGQGGRFVSLEDRKVTITAPGDRTFTYDLDEGDGYEVIVEQAFPAGECLEYSDDCHGPVELRWPGSGDRTWPRCVYHGDLRVERAESSIERYADSDVPPTWFDPTAIGERWDEDY